MNTIPSGVKSLLKFACKKLTSPVISERAPPHLYLTRRDCIAIGNFIKELLDKQEVTAASPNCNEYHTIVESLKDDEAYKEAQNWAKAEVYFASKQVDELLAQPEPEPDIDYIVREIHKKCFHQSLNTAPVITVRNALSIFRKYLKGKRTLKYIVPKDDESLDYDLLLYSQIRDLLAEPEQEPVAWMYDHHIEVGHDKYTEFNVVEACARNLESENCINVRPLYLAPPKRDPVELEDVIKQIHDKCYQTSFDTAPVIAVRDALTIFRNYLKSKRDITAKINDI